MSQGTIWNQSLESLNVNLLDDPSFVVNDFCEGAPNSASSIVTSGGIFSFNPTPTSGEKLILRLVKLLEELKCLT